MVNSYAIEINQKLKLNMSGQKFKTNMLNFVKKKKTRWLFQIKNDFNNEINHI
jgi:hypothetical protein